MLRKLVVSLVVLPILWIASSTAPASASAPPTLEGRCCCSHHHGQCGCQGNQVVCCGQLDEVSYFSGLESERLPDLPSARRNYLDLITKFPKSKYLPLSYFAFGEFFFEDAQGDVSRSDAAIQAYQKVAKGTGPSDLLNAWTWIRLGQIYELRNDRASARTAYVNAAAFVRLNPQAQGASDLAAAIPKWVK